MEINPDNDGVVDLAARLSVVNLLSNQSPGMDVSSTEEYRRPMSGTGSNYTLYYIYSNGRYGSDATDPLANSEISIDYRYRF